MKAEGGDDAACLRLGEVVEGSPWRADVGDVVAEAAEVMTHDRGPDRVAHALAADAVEDQPCRGSSA